MIKPILPSLNRGWIALELVLCLSLFAVVLHLIQQQNQIQWHSLELASQQLKQQENQNNKEALALLTGSNAWLQDTNNSKPLAYPNCQKCRGVAFKKWFHASQHFIVNSMEAKAMQGSAP